VLLIPNSLQGSPPALRYPHGPPPQPPPTPAPAPALRVFPLITLLFNAVSVCACTFIFVALTVLHHQTHIFCNSVHLTCSLFQSSQPCFAARADDCICSCCCLLMSSFEPVDSPPKSPVDSPLISAIRFSRSEIAVLNSLPDVMPSVTRPGHCSNRPINSYLPSCRSSAVTDLDSFISQQLSSQPLHFTPQSCFFFRCSHCLYYRSSLQQLDRKPVRTRNRFCTLTRSCGNICSQPAFFFCESCRHHVCPWCQVFLKRKYDAIPPPSKKPLTLRTLFSRSAGNIHNLSIHELPIPMFLISSGPITNHFSPGAADNPICIDTDNDTLA